MGALSKLCVLSCVPLMVNICFAESAPQVVETFIPPQKLKITNPRYPVHYQRSGQEGWVTMTYMIDPAGEPYDVAVVSSAGGEGFKRAAIQAVEKWRFEPARLNGRPIDASASHRITFQLSGDTGAHPKFVKRYRKLNSAVAAGDQAKATKLLDELATRDRNLYEEALLHLALADYHAKWGNTRDRYLAITRAAFLDGVVGFLPPDALNRVLLMKISLELKQNLFGAARQTADVLRNRDITDEWREKVTAIIAELDTLDERPGTITVAGWIGANDRFVHRLVKGSFTFEEVDGRIAEMRLHCEKGYAGLIFQQDLTYTVQDNLDICLLTVIGDPGTTFSLVEY